MVELPKVDELKNMYYELKRAVQEDVDVMNRDISDKLYKYFMQKIGHGVLVNIALVGEPGMGKSTVALELMRVVNILLSRYHKKTIDNYDMIASDDTEFIRMAKDESRRQVCMTVDEYNPMGSTGANATTEIAEADFFSNLCRVYYIHRIKCAPIKITDPNVEVILEVMGKDIENKKTHCKVIYRNIREAQSIELGVVWIDVSKTLEADWYRRYEKKKKMRVDLLNQHAIRDVRELEQADIAKDIIDEYVPDLSEMKKADMMAMVRVDIINKMKKKYKVVLSWLAEDEITKPIGAILFGMMAVNKMKNQDVKKRYFAKVQDNYGELNKRVNILKRYRSIE